jgi:hypothetical protein
VDLPRPAAQPTAPVVLGGSVTSKLSDAYLVTSIIYPSYELAPYPKDQIATGGGSRMPHHADQMTVRQLTDIVLFLQSHYFVPRMPKTPALSRPIPNNSMTGKGREAVATKVSYPDV